MKNSARIYVAGHRGMVGSAIMRNLESHGYSNIITSTHDELDLTNQSAVSSFFEKSKPEYVFLAAAKVGGIVANSTYGAQFIYENLMIEANVIHASYLSGVKKLMFLGSSCIYPRMATQPMTEDQLLTGLLEPTNEPYAVAKIAGIKMCDAYRAQYGCNFVSAMPTNLYGRGDNYDLTTSHVIPAILRKMHSAKTESLAKVELWGTGAPLREFMNADDMADATVFLMQNYDLPGHINVGTGEEFSIREVAEIIRYIVGFEGEIVWDSSRPDGTPRKLMDSSRLSDMGWRPTITLEQGLRQVYSDLLESGRFL